MSKTINWISILMIEGNLNRNVFWREYKTLWEVLKSLLKGFLAGVDCPRAKHQFAWSFHRKFAARDKLWSINSSLGQVGETPSGISTNEGEKSDKSIVFQFGPWVLYFGRIGMWLEWIYLVVQLTALLQACFLLYWD